MRLSTPTVHVAPQGYERERVYQPPINEGADTVIQIRHTESTKKGIECKEDVRRVLADNGIECIEEECDFFSLNDSVWAIGEVIESYPDSDIYVNISTGSKITAIAAVIACTATDATPYYVRASGYEGETVTTGIESIDPLNTYPLNLPHEDYLKVLDFIQKNEDVIKGDIVSFVKDMPLLSKYDRNAERNMYGPVEKEVLEPLVERKYIKEIPRGNETLYDLTEDGEEQLRVLKYLLD